MREGDPIFIIISDLITNKFALAMLGLKALRHAFTICEIDPKPKKMMRFDPKISDSEMILKPFHVQNL